MTDEVDYFYIRKLRQRRKDRGLSQAYVAQQAGITQERLSKLEREEACPRPWEIDRIATVLGWRLALIPAEVATIR